MAVSDTIFARPNYIGLASNLTHNDSDPDGDAFEISGAAHGGTPAVYDAVLGAFKVQGNYGTLLLLPDGFSVTAGGFVNIYSQSRGLHFCPRHGHRNLNSLGDLPIYDLQPGQTLSDTFTYTITDSNGAISLPATITVTFEPSYIDLRVHTASGYDTTTLLDDLHVGVNHGDRFDASSRSNSGRTILIDARG